MLIQEALKFGASELHKFPRSLLEAELLLAYTLGVDRIYLHTHFLTILDSFSQKRYLNFIKRRKNYEPIEYIIENVSFYSSEFYISHGALIPRPESEILVDLALKTIQKNHLKNIAEVGVGSGILSITLAKMLPLCNFSASDISPEALFNAYVNKEKFQISNLTLHKSAYLDFNCGKIKSFDLLISNPPYIKEGFSLPKPLEYEPKIALFGGEEGDEILHHLIDLAYQLQIPFLICEMGYDQKESIYNYTQKFNYKNLEFYKDLANLDRGFILEF
ncbi:HemK/PrmC family methyltransferase [Helicobacter burdigaliensis]|uniref:HemK/PrmC family methyltransferase n=1 Tax=Helicobacter burdigaliensis TaxID=2315334 RepID=UPI000EF654D8|nr:HemK/PrmC family methyltransferase [Helicobacter burdigaliensis]